MYKGPKEIYEKLRTIPNYPKEGIMFQDITTVLKDRVAFKNVIDILHDKFQDEYIHYVVGIESRGFILGAALADSLNVGFIPIRKKGKLPAETISEDYNLEYGKGTLEIHQDAIKKGERVLIIDDLIATGGTAIASAKLVTRLGGEVVSFAFLVNLADLSGLKSLKESGYESFVIIDYKDE